MRPARRNPESGFAVLMIYSMAVVIAIMLFMHIPRVAFEAQRDKEQLLIDRGEQYSRAIQLYVRKFNKFPPDFEALNNTQNLRFLRRKYKDPMTGKDDWRIIHVGPGGVFTDSLTHEKKKDDSKGSEPQNFITELAPLGGAQGANQNVNIATRQRQSDQPGAPGDPNIPAQPPQLDANGNPIQLPPGAFPIVGQQPGAPGFPNQPQFNANGTPTAPGQPFPGQNLPNQGFQNQGLPGQSGFPIQGNPPGFGQQNQQPGAAPPPGGAAGLINQLLTTPRPGGLNGMGGVQIGVPNPAVVGQTGATTSTLGGAPGTPLPPAAGQTVIGGGIAGVASKLEEDGIKVYNDQSSYNKWEFVYDITKDPARTGATAIPAGGAQQNANGQNPNVNGIVGQQPTGAFGAPPPPPPPPSGTIPAPQQ